MSETLKSVFDLSRETHYAFEQWMANPGSMEAEQRYYAVEAEYKQAILNQYQSRADRVKD